MIRGSHQFRHHLDSLVAHVLELGMMRDADDLALVGAQPRQRLRRETAQVRHPKDCAATYGAFSVLVQLALGSSETMPSSNAVDDPLS